MSSQIHPLKQLFVSISLLIALICCNKPQAEETTDPTPAGPPFEVLLTAPTVSYCGSTLTSDLKIKDGTVIGTVLVGNDATHLFLSYRLTDHWYLTGTQGYAGTTSSIPLTPNNTPDYNHFPSKKALNACDLAQTLCFKIPLSSLQTDNNAQCFTNAQFFIAMRATVKNVSNGNCRMGNEEEAWAAPVLINPGNANEWATAFYYCKQDCTPWCAYGQGYWFSKPNVEWCQSSVKFGNLEVVKDSARTLWPAQTNLMKKAFFQASALQLSMSCNNNNRPIPMPIVDDYNKLAAFLEGISYTDIKKGIIPSNADTAAIKTAAGNIGKWICANNCNAANDPTTCE